MNEPSIYRYVKSKLITHGVERTEDGLITLSDSKLLSLFVRLERAVRVASFSETLTVVREIEEYATSIGKEHLVVFAFMYLRFSYLTPKTWDLDTELPDGKVQITNIYERQLSDEEVLIGLWAKVKYDTLGQQYLAVVYRD